MMAVSVPVTITLTRTKIPSLIPATIVWVFRRPLIRGPRDRFDWWGVPCASAASRMRTLSIGRFVGCSSWVAPGLGLERGAVLEVDRRGQRLRRTRQAVALGAAALTVDRKIPAVEGTPLVGGQAHGLPDLALAEDLVEPFGVAIRALQQAGELG